MQKPLECLGCPLYEKGKSFSIPEGKGTSGVIGIGEALGREEAYDGLPFRPKAQAGSKLEEAFRLLGIDRDYFHLWNVIACQPPNNQLTDTPYEKQAIEHCSVHFEKVFNNFHTPFNKTVLAFGNVPLVRLTGVTGDSEKKESISHLRGYVFESGYGWVVPTYHPSYLRRGNGHLTPVFLDDIKKALAVAKGTYNTYKGGKGYKEPQYQTKPSVDDARSFLYRVHDNRNLVLSYDIETPTISDAEEEEKGNFNVGPIEILQIQFSLRKGEGIAFPWEGEYIKIAKEILALPNIKANHNTWNFDNPILRNEGVVFGGKIHDTMWMFKHWHPQLERGLQKVASLFNFPFAWKHLYGSMLGYYGCADVDAVQYLIAALPKLMKEKGVWGGYTRYVYDLHLGMDNMVARGVPVDETERESLQTDLQGKMDKLDAEMQEIYPNELKGMEPKRTNKETGEVSYGYKRQPKEITELILEGKTEGMEGRELGLWIFERSGLQVKALKENGEIIRRWVRTNEFKPSKEQVVKYLRWKQEHSRTKSEALKYRVPLKFKPDPKTGVKKETTGKDELIPIWEATDDKLIENIIKFRSVKKLITNDIPNWEPDEDGRVHSEIGFKAPTGQLDARKPNIFNASKHATPEAIALWGGDESEVPTKQFRRMLKAPPGRCFVEMDKKSFHVGMMGCIADDEEYFRFSQLDPHSIFTSWIVDGFEPIQMRWSNADILEACREVKKRFKDVRQQQAKPAVLGNQLGLGPYKLQRQNRKFIKTVKQAEMLQERIKHRFVKVEKCKERLIDEGYRNGWDGIVNPFGRIQYFFEVYKWVWNWHTNHWEKKHGDDTEALLAYHVQGCSFGMIQDEILDLEEEGLNEKYHFINTIHDSTIFVPYMYERDKCIEEVYEVMTRKNKHLRPSFAPEGLVIQVEASVGKEGGSLRDMEEVKI